MFIILFIIIPCLIVLYFNKKTKFHYEYLLYQVFRALENIEPEPLRNKIILEKTEMLYNENEIPSQAKFYKILTTKSDPDKLFH